MKLKEQFSLKLKAVAPYSLELTLHKPAGCAVIVVVIFRILEEVSRGNSPFEFLRAQKEVIMPVLLAPARRPRRARHRIHDVRRPVQQPLAQRALPAARRRRHHNHQTAALRCWTRFAHSMFWICSRIFSSSAFIFTTCCEISAAFALEPIVLISRPISCARKSSVRPTGSFDFRQSRN